jgi:predicted nuclease of predicted toxin-antitoxin system
MSEISLYLDEDVRVLLAEVLRSRGYHATHVLDVKRTGRSDAEQLAHAAKNGMAILTHIRDYCPHNSLLLKKPFRHYHFRAASFQ